jgi:hemerythrin superfamily protein
MSDIYQVLSEEHRKVADVLGRLADSGAAQPAERVELFPALKQDLLLHAQAEEATFYRALREHADVRDDIREASDEHDQIEALLSELSSMDKTTALWGKKIIDLQNAVEHHVSEEEDEIFDAARDLFSDAEARELAVAFEQEKQRLCDTV